MSFTWNDTVTQQEHISVGASSLLLFITKYQMSSAHVNEFSFAFESECGQCWTFVCINLSGWFLIIDAVCRISIKKHEYLKLSWLCEWYVKVVYAQHGSLPASSLKTSSFGWFKAPVLVMSQFVLFLIQCDFKLRNKFKNKRELILKIMHLLVRNCFFNINFCYSCLT